MAKEKFDAYQVVTDQIVKALEAGTRPWTKSWAGGSGGLPLRHNGQPYSGVNILILGLSGFSNPYWMTFKQAQEYGGKVRKGSKSTKIVFFKAISITDKVSEEEKNIPLLRTYNVFNAEQIEGLPERFYPGEEVRNQGERIEAAESFFAAQNANLVHEGSQAYYRPSLDQIVMPAFEKFDDPEAYYGTLSHEFAHWTGHKSRLDRDLKTSFGSRDYAREELVAELASSFVMHNLGLSAEPREDHAEYLAEWLKVLKEDKRAIFRASAAAQKACDFLVANTNPETKKEAA